MNVVNGNIPLTTILFQMGTAFLLMGIVFVSFRSEIPAFLGVPRTAASVELASTSGVTAIVLGASTLAGAIAYTAYLVGGTQ